MVGDDSFQTVAVIVLVLVIVVYKVYNLLRHRTSRSKGKSQITQVSEKASHAQNVYHDITPLANLAWNETEPLQLRPFKPKYHLTMAIENMTLSELVEMDKTYLDRIRLRRQLIEEQNGAVVAANEKIQPAVNEFYTWMMGTYLPRRFPTMFKITEPVASNTSSAGQSDVSNLVTNESIPIAPPSDAVKALKIIGGNIDTDFLFLLPSSDPTDEGKYKLEGFVTCFPSGFDTRLKLNRKLAEIHAPVPGYAAKIEKSMDRFFANLPVGKIVRRTNWSIITNTKLFSLGGNHLYEGETPVQEEVDIDQTVLRCERQTLHRLPESGAIVFAFKTYQYPIKQIKEEGAGEELARAIDGLKEGNVPHMVVYKRQVIWGDSVKRYLRS